MAGKSDEAENQIVVSPEVFSPNGDGFNDQLSIQYQFTKPGFVANVRIFDASGKLVKYLVKNQLQSQSGSWIWDGKSDSGKTLEIGVFIILVEIYNEAGETKALKRTCTLTDRLN